MLAAVYTILVESVKTFLGLMPLVILAMFVANWLMSHSSQRVIDRFLARKASDNILTVSLIGVALAPGTLSCYLPALRTLRKMGVPQSLIAAFICAQTLVGPARAFMEVPYFGLGFYAFRVVASFAIAAAVGWVYHTLEKRHTF